MDIAGALQALREDNGLTQEQLAAKAGVTRPYVSQIETGKKEPKVSTIADLCDAMEVSPVAFVVLAIEEDEIRDDGRELWNRIKPHLTDLILKS
jgi:transcriptional regulator with XRE-family HTH domain